jgi:hypothetical protein
MKDTSYQYASEVERLDHDFLATLGLRSSEQTKNTQVGMMDVRDIMEWSKKIVLSMQYILPQI